MNTEELKKQIRKEFAKKGGEARWKEKSPEEKSEHGKLMAKARKSLKNKDK